MNVVVEVNGCDAIPVRAVPFLTDWAVMSPDEIADALAWDDHNFMFHGMAAYRREDEQVKAIGARWWKSVCRRLKELSDSIRRTEVTNDTGYREWQLKSLPLLPAGAFVWKDEFEAKYAIKYGRGWHLIRRGQQTNVAG